MNRRLLGPGDDNDPPEVPAWLEEELRANVVFVQEAIENGDVCGDLAAAWLVGGNYAEVIERAVSAWVEYVWKRSDCDAPHVQRVWAEFERDCAQARRRCWTPPSLASREARRDPPSQ